MKKTIFLMAFLAIFAAVTFADWQVGDGHKMHYPQTPKKGGYDVEFANSVLADDWRCSQTGTVDDIHFWVSWMDNAVQEITGVVATIFSDIPASQSQTGYSMPGEPLWQYQFSADMLQIRDMPDDPQRWFDPSSGSFTEPGTVDHTRWQQINIPKIPDPFIQKEGTIYWLALEFGDLPFIGWKETDKNFNDDAVWWSGQRWLELRDPANLDQSIDLAFVITPEPATILMLAFGGAALLRKR